MKLGLQLGYWALSHRKTTGNSSPRPRTPDSTPCSPPNVGSDAYTPLAWWGSSTQRLRLGTSVVQLSARTPTACAMAALTLDHLSGGRHILGLGVSGPQVVEGWYGQSFPKPLARTREYIDIIRQVWAREKPVTSDGPALSAAIDGSVRRVSASRSSPLPIRCAPTSRSCWAPRGRRMSLWPLRSATAGCRSSTRPAWPTPTTSGSTRDSPRPGARRSREDFEICATANIVITDDRSAALAAMKPYIALYMGGMGAEDTNFHADVYRRMGYAEVVDDVTKLFRSDQKDKAAGIIPDEVIDDAAIVGDLDYVRKQIKAWEAAGVTMMVVSGRNTEQVREVATLV